eukprot:17251_1
MASVKDSLLSSIDDTKHNISATNDPLATLLKKHYLYEDLYRLLHDNSVDLEMLENDVELQEVDEFCKAFGLNEQKFKFRKLMRIIFQQKIQNDTVETKHEQKTDNDSLAADDRMQIVVIGDMNVGKTSLFLCFTQKSFQNVEPTMGINCARQIATVCDWNVDIYVLDTAGQEPFQACCRPHYKRADCIFICYDISQIEPFDNLTQWKFAIEEYAPDEVVVFLVGNKLDLAEANERYSTNRCLAQTMMREEQWKNWNGVHMECSAKTGQNVDLIFKTAVEAVGNMRLKKMRKEVQKTNKFTEYKELKNTFDVYKSLKEKDELYAETQRLKQQLADLQQNPTVKKKTCCR